MNVVNVSDPDVGVSPRALSLARHVDRLGDGDFVIYLTRQGDTWQAVVRRQETVRNIVIFDKPPETC